MRGSAWSTQPRDACCFPCWCRFIAMEIIPTRNLSALCYGWWGCRTRPKAFPSNQTLLIQKARALPKSLHSDQLMGTGEALEEGADQVLCSQILFFLPLWWALMAQSCGSSICSSLTLYLPVLCSFLPLSNPKYLLVLCQCMGLFPISHSASILLVPHVPSHMFFPFTFHVHIFLPPCSLPLSFFLSLCHLPIASLPVLSSSFLPWCHFNYWPILCLLSSLSLFSPLLSLRDSSLSLPICFRDAVAVGF